MNPQLVSILAAITASQARIAGMVAENQQRLVCNNSICYGEDSFLTEAQHLDQLSIEARNA